MERSGSHAGRGGADGRRRLGRAAGRGWTRLSEHDTATRTRDVTAPRLPSRPTSPRVNRIERDGGIENRKRSRDSEKQRKRETSCSCRGRLVDAKQSLPTDTNAHTQPQHPIPSATCTSSHASIKVIRPLTTVRPSITSAMHLSSPESSHNCVLHGSVPGQCSVCHPEQCRYHLR
jgi:hypothetical protein